MIQFNDKNIFVGYIKELLHTFNLPTVKVYKKDSSFLYDGAVFIKDNFIQQYSENNGKATWKKLSPFVFDKPIWNFTKTLKLTNSYYDSHTHAYLGEYLRFIRDYKDLNLMSMYNCFNNNVVSSLSFTFKYGNGIKRFNTDSNYKIYSVPVKFDKNYTIAFSTNTPVEIICGIYSKGIVKSDDINILYATTYERISCSNFKKPFIYNKLKSDALKTKFFYEHEQDLKLFIKVPLDNKTSFTVLEGEYLNTNEKYLFYKKDSEGEVANLPTWKHKKTVFNFRMPKPVEEPGKEYPLLYGPRTQTVYKLHTDFETVDTTGINNMFFSSSLQLLEINSEISFPFADRLIEYLLDNVVTNIETIGDNIERVQEALIKRQDDSRYVKTIINGKEVTEKLDTPTKSGILDYKHAGLWEDRYKGVLYNVAAEEGVIDNEFDVLGYLDKDVENKLRRSEVDIYEKE